MIALRDVLATILQANMAVISNQQNEISVRQNETMKQLTLVATIFLPLTFITGFFGMNFGWLTGDIGSFWVFAVYGLGSLVLSAVVDLHVVPPQRRHRLGARQPPGLAPATCTTSTIANASPRRSRSLRRSSHAVASCPRSALRREPHRPPSDPGA